MELLLGMLMNLRFVLLPLIVVLTSCSSKPPTNGWRSDDVSKIDRTKELFACSKFFRIVAMQRASDREEFEGLYKKSERLAFGIMPSYKESEQTVKDELTQKYNRYGNYTANKWVVSIGKDKSKKLFPKITQDCHSTVQREDLFNTTQELSKKLNIN